jgi:hypothetical protein
MSFTIPIRSLFSDRAAICVVTLDLCLMRIAIPPFYANGHLGIPHIIFIVNEPAIAAGAILTGSMRAAGLLQDDPGGGTGLVIAIGAMIVLQWLVLTRLARCAVRFVKTGLRPRVTNEVLSPDLTFQASCAPIRGPEHSRPMRRPATIQTRQPRSTLSIQRNQ